MSEIAIGLLGIMCGFLILNVMAGFSHLFEILEDIRKELKRL